MFLSIPFKAALAQRFNSRDTSGAHPAYRRLAWACLAGANLRCG